MIPDPELERAEEEALDEVDDEELVEFSLEDIEAVQEEARQNLGIGGHIASIERLKAFTTQPESLDEFIDRHEAEYREAKAQDEIADLVGDETDELEEATTNMEEEEPKEEVVNVGYKFTIGGTKYEV